MSHAELVAAAILVNAACGGVIFIYAACRLSTRQYPLRHPMLWAHALMLCGAAALALLPLYCGRPSILHALSLHVGVALACLCQIKAWTTIGESHDQPQ